MSQVLEMVQFRLDPAHEREYVAGHPAAMEAIAAAFPGLIRVNLVRFPDGRYADVALWESRADAERAAQGCVGIPEFKRLGAFVTETISLELTEVVGSDG
jgi:hypothetical protein